MQDDSASGHTDRRCGFRPVFIQKNGRGSVKNPARLGAQVKR